MAPEKPERIEIRAAMGITGRKLRALEGLSARGLVPGAAKLGGVWTYDEARLRRWVREEEDRACRATSIAGEKSGGAEYRSPAGNTEKAYEQLFAPKRSSASTHGARR
jgi:hypothetical protein